MFISMRSSSLKTYKILFGCLIFLGSCHVGRFFIFNFADLDDYKKFPERSIKPSNQCYSFEEQKMDLFKDEQELESLISDSKTASFLVIKDDKILYEYNDESISGKWVSTFSMAKSFVGLLTGIAIEEGLIESEQDPVTKYIDYIKDPSFEKITIKHLLDMQTGIDYNENYYNPFGNVAVGYYGRNLKRHISNLKTNESPGKYFDYISISTQLLGEVLQEVSDTTLSYYFQEKIWQKVGTCHEASWSLDSKNGTEKAFCCLNGKTLDFAKVGKMMLDGGSFEGERVVPKNWVVNSTTIHAESSNQQYQNQWWLMGASDRSQSHLVDYCAQGHLGQYLYINPVKRTIIVRFGDGYGNVSWVRLFKRINELL